MTTGRFQALEFHWQLYGDELDDMTVVSRPAAVIRVWEEQSFNDNDEPRWDYLSERE